MVDGLLELARGIGPSGGQFTGLDQPVDDKLGTFLLILGNSDGLLGGNLGEQAMVILDLERRDTAEENHRQAQVEPDLGGGYAKH